MFSGLNLAFFSISRLRLEIEASNGNPAAVRVLGLRQDSNFVLTTVLWGNVAINVLLTLLSNSVMVGMSSFLFSTVAITLGGEILPQAYFSRNALRMASVLSPIFRFYQFLLYPFAKPSSLILDYWLGKESLLYMKEQDLRKLIHKHIDANETDLSAIEGMGALNFLAIDDIPVVNEGERLAPESILSLPLVNGNPVFFDAGASEENEQEFVRMLQATLYRWLILVGQDDLPIWALDADSYLRAMHRKRQMSVDPMKYCHKPIVVTDPSVRLGSVIAQFKGQVSAHSDAPFPRRIVLFWGVEKRIITASDILGRLFKGIGRYSAIGHNDLNKR